MCFAAKQQMMSSICVGPHVYTQRRRLMCAFIGQVSMPRDILGEIWNYVRPTRREESFGIVEVLALLRGRFKVHGVGFYIIYEDGTESKIVVRVESVHMLKHSLMVWTNDNDSSANFIVNPRAMTALLRCGPIVDKIDNPDKLSIGYLMSGECAINFVAL